MKRLLLLAPLLFVSCEKEKAAVQVPEIQESQPAKIDYSSVLPDNPDGIFFRTLRQAPYRRVEIDFRTPTDMSGLPDVKWFPMGSYEFCAIQGTTDTRIILPSGRVIEEEFEIVYIDRDHEGIYEVKADSIGWLKEDVAKRKLKEEVDLLIQEGGEVSTIRTQMKKVIGWLDNYDHNSGMRQGVFFASEQFFQYFGFAVTLNTNMGIRYRHHYRLDWNDERRKASKTREAQ